ncbi:betaine--homocysteine s-methyltransferase 1-like [Plakobranchus ocellatus]|uniref:Betaine--homocysteine s-methyltransferase 1-like n=1 Tax=Plakobranchus ocellatus TaxID=259542 RepID=A0AAV3Z577_9GAST|nr:betaine--homocysteine s-methyltransferase 1-like [Plakobranchus ocellatus]
MFNCSTLKLLIMLSRSYCEAFLRRLKNGETVIAAEGYLFEFERRGYLQAGAFVPEVVTEHPELVKQLHEEFVHAGSDVVLAFTYYGHREKLRLIGKEDELENLNRKALSIAKDVAKATGTLMAGNICNTTLFRSDDQSIVETVRAMFKEQIEWAVEAGADFIVGETFLEFREAMLALESIKQFGQGLPAVIMIAPSSYDYTVDGVPYEEACRQLEEAGAAAVGLNCCRGPKSIMPAMAKIRKACKGPIACLPVPYRTSSEFPTMQSLIDPDTKQTAFPYNLPAQCCSRTEIENFAKECKELGVQYVGLCCGSCSHYLRVLAEVYGRKPPASKYSPDMSKHYTYGDNSTVRQYNEKIFRAFRGDKK